MIWQPAVKIGEYPAHTMGANAVSAVIVEDGATAGTRVLIGSGGDDQSICCACCSIPVSLDDFTPLFQYACII